MELNTTNASNWDLNYWSSDEWKTTQERLDAYEKAGHIYCPGKHNIFSALDIKPEEVRVCIVGQDPYPNPRHCTGIAFSVPKDVGEGSLPPTLRNIFREYQSDLHYPAPKNGDLTPWVNQGVLLWNAYPSCEAWRPGSHHWDEWRPLTIEILERLNVHEVVFVYLGAVARSYAYVTYDMVGGPERNATTVSEAINPNIFLSHPSPLGANKGFLGSRIFSRINGLLKTNPIDWRLP